jgi:hypothetical protein
MTIQGDKMSNSIFNTTEIDFENFFENFQFLFKDHKEVDRIFSILSSNVTNMKMLLEEPPVLQQLRKQNIDIIKLREDVDYLEIILVMIFNYTLDSTEYSIEAIKFYYKKRYLESIATLEKFSVSSTEHLEWLNSNLKDL